jgi:hypothetical protein
VAAPPFVTGSIVTATEMNTLWRAHWRKSTEKDIVSTASEVDLLNGEVTIDAGAMSTNRWLSAILLGDYLNNTGSTQTFTLKVKLGGTTIFDDVTSTISSDADRNDWRLDILIANLGSASSQFTQGVLFWAGGVAAATGLGDLAGAESGLGAANTHTVIPFGSNNVTSINTAVASAFAVTVAHGASNASLSMRLKAAVVSVI